MKKEASRPPESFYYPLITEQRPLVCCCRAVEHVPHRCSMVKVSLMQQPRNIGKSDKFYRGFPLRHRESRYAQAPTGPVRLGSRFGRRVRRTVKQMINCEIQGCTRYASNAVILGTRRFCEVPLFSERNTLPPLVRFDLCAENKVSV